VNRTEGAVGSKTFHPDSLHRNVPPRSSHRSLAHKCALPSHHYFGLWWSRGQITDSCCDTPRLQGSGGLRRVPCTAIPPAAWHTWRNSCVSSRALISSGQPPGARRISGADSKRSLPGYVEGETKSIWFSRAVNQKIAWSHSLDHSKLCSKC